MYSLALKSDGSLVGWGYNSYGEGDGPDGNNFVDITAENYHNIPPHPDSCLSKHYLYLSTISIRLLAFPENL